MYKSIKGSSISLLNFRREVAQQALKQCGTPRSRLGPKTIATASQLPMLSGSTKKTIGQFLFQLATPDVFLEEDPQLSVRSAMLHCMSSASKCITKLKIYGKAEHCIFM